MSEQKILISFSEYTKLKLIEKKYNESIKHTSGKKMLLYTLIFALAETLTNWL